VPTAYDPTDLERDIAATAAKASDEVMRAFEALQPSAALEATWTLVKRANRYVEETKPWTLAKDPSQASRLDTVLTTLLECARLAGSWAWPAIPRKAEELWLGLGLADSPGKPLASSEPASGGATATPSPDPRSAWFEGKSAPPLGGVKLPEVRILFPKIEVPV